MSAGAYCLSRFVRSLDAHQRSGKPYSAASLARLHLAVMAFNAHPCGCSDCSKIMNDVEFGRRQ